MTSEIVVWLSYVLSILQDLFVLCMCNTIWIGTYHYLASTLINVNDLWLCPKIHLYSCRRLRHPAKELNSIPPLSPCWAVHDRSYQMKLSNALSPLADLRYAIGASLWPTILDICGSPSLLLRPAALSQVVMAHVWVLFGNPTDEGGRLAKEGLITPNAHGVVLDIGAGMSRFTPKPSFGY